jgi:hypothetical protein
MLGMAVRVMTAMCAVGVGAMAAGQAGPAPQERAHVETNFDVVVHAPYAEAARLFGPEGERAWAGKHWDPRFVYPQPGRDEQGAVFTIQHGPLEAVWVVARHDVEARHFQYVYVIPGIMACTIEVGFRPVDAGTTNVHVTYERTALSAEGDGHVATMAEGDRKAGPEWQAAIERYLSGRQVGVEQH